MKKMILMMLVLTGVFSGCTTAPPKEAAVVRDIGDKEVMKLRIIAERNTNALYARKAALAWEAWNEAWAAAKALDPAGKIDAEFAVKSIEMRDEKLQQIENSRLAEMSQIQGLHDNYISTSGALYEAWEESGKISAAAMNDMRKFATDMGSLVIEYQHQKSLAKAAKAAAEAAKTEEGE